MTMKKLLETVLRVKIVNPLSRAEVIIITAIYGTLSVLAIAGLIWCKLHPGVPQITGLP